jgi:hypothetical protein
MFFHLFLSFHSVAGQRHVNSSLSSLHRRLSGRLQTADSSTTNCAFHAIAASPGHLSHFHRTFYASSHLPLPRLVAQSHRSKHRYSRSRWPITASRPHDSPLLGLVDSVAVCRAPNARRARIRRPICMPSPHIAAPTGTRAPVVAPRTMSLPLLPKKVQVPSAPRTR